MTGTRRLRDRERGAAMIFTLLAMAMVTVIGLTLTSTAMSTLAMSTAESETGETLAIADAGIEHGKQLVLWQDWQSLNVFLTRGDGNGCTFDELADVPTGTPPAGYPLAGSANFIPLAGRPFGQGRYFVELCDNHTQESAALAPNTDANPNNDNDKRVFLRSVGYGPRGARAAVEVILGAAAMPAVVVQGNLEVRGNPTVTGPAGSIHANGVLELSGNPCTYVYYSSTAATTASGNVQGGASCTAAGVDSRPFSPRINLPSLSPYNVARQAQAAGFTVYTMQTNGTVFTGLPAGPAGSGIASTLVGPIPVPAGFNFQNNGKTWRTSGQTQAGTYYVLGNADVTANTGAVGGGDVQLTILVEGSLTANGNPDVRPHATIPFIGPILVVAGHDIDLGATFDSSYNGLFYARHQLEISGSPTLNGQVIALNEFDTAHETKNPVPLGNGAIMKISGSPTINYSGNGLQSVRALTWRECRADWAGFQAGVNPGTSCGAP